MTLADPTDSDEMYLEPGGGLVPFARPIMFGDVFKDVPCLRGGSPSPFVMVMTHPCSMRNGTQLKESLVTATLGDPNYPGRKSSKWSNGYFDQMPVFDVAPISPILAVNLADLHASSSSDLKLENRVLALSNRGVAVTLQRWIYQLSRDPVPIEELSEFVAPAMAEVEIQEDWCEVALQRAPIGSDRDEVLTNGAERVQHHLGRPGTGGLRDALHEPSSRADVWRRMKALRVSELGA